MICNNYVKELIKTKKGSRIFYDIFVGVNDYFPQGKWQAEIGDINENEWKLYFLNIKQYHEVKFRDFQYKINNRNLVTNSFLFKISKKKKVMYVPIVGNNQKKIFHLFLLCPKVRTFWNELKVWLYTYFYLLENYIYVLAKYYIYQNKFISRNISIQAFVSLLKKNMLSERYIAFINNRLSKFFKKWSP